ncbi:heavy metal-associated isoprenylated plant protein 3-like [Iris pallida]|uniref:Heavy metal-associated isoprenylated plant protein 3-like n=1 Tax=Iris pallida TaxID=29817 RepID=A0AAX6H263_IRIPA|nr:heavy metal-associated isoprenylated plant protein 3-like [Iris pallida]
MASNKLTVVGNVDPLKIRERLESKTHKKVDLLTPVPKADPEPNKKAKPDQEQQRKPESKQPKTAVSSTVAMKIRLHCDGCIQRIRKTILKYKGVESVTIDSQKDLVTVTGTMDAGSLVPYLKDKLKRSVDVVAPRRRTTAVLAAARRRKRVAMPAARRRKRGAAAAEEMGRRRRREGRRRRRRWREEGEGERRWRRRGQEKREGMARRRRRRKAAVAEAGEEGGGGGDNNGSKQDGVLWDLWIRKWKRIRIREWIPHGDGARSADVQRREPKRVLDNVMRSVWIESGRVSLCVSPM